MKHSRGRTVLTLVGALLALQWSLTAQSPAPPTAKRPLTYDVVDYWKSIQGTKLSDDGQWLAYATTAQAEDGHLVVRNLRTGQEFTHERGASPSFTPDGKFVVFTIAQPKADEEKEADATETATPEAPAAGRGRPSTGSGQAARSREPKTGMGIMTLPDGQVKTFEKVGSWRLPEKSSSWVAYYKGTGGTGAGGRGGRGGRGAAPTTPAARGGNAASTREKHKEPGSDLILRNLTTGDEATIPEVSEYEWDQQGNWLAYAVSSADAAKDGAFARRINDGTVAALHTGRGHYKSLAFDDTGLQLAFISDEADYAQKASPYRLYYWKAPAGTSAGGPALEVASGATPGMPQGMVVSEFGDPHFSKDGARLYVGTGPPPDPPADPNAKTPPPTKVDLWNYHDPIIQPMQKVRDQQERERNYRAVIHLADKRFVQLATPDLPTVTVGDDPAQLLGTSDMPYRQEISWDQDYRDVFLLDLKTGKPKKVLEHWGSSATMSPGGKYVLYFDEQKGQWFTYRVADGARANLTEKVDTRFQQENNTPDLPGPYGSAGWTGDDKSVLLYDEFDVWEVKPDGTGAHMVTNGAGRKTGTVFRYRPMDPDQTAVPSSAPLLLSAVDDRTRASGFYRIASLATTAAPEKVVMLDKSFGTPTKAKQADTVVFTLSRYRGIPRSLGERHDLQGHEEGVERQSAGLRVPDGPL